MQNLGDDTFTFMNSNGMRYCVKFSFSPEHGVYCFVWDDVIKLHGRDMDLHREDLDVEADNTSFFNGRTGIQGNPESRERALGFEDVDTANTLSGREYPIRGRRRNSSHNVDNCFTQSTNTEYCTNHHVSGVDFSNDALQQGCRYN